MAYKPFIKLANDEMVELPLCAEKIGTETIGSTSEPVYIDQGKPKSCSALKTMMLDFIYPIGSYFITESSSFNTITKVANHFGGTWVRVTGRFLYDNNSTAGQTGGSNDAVIVSHNHTFTGTAASHSHSVLGASRAKDSYAYACGGSDAAACIGGLPKNNTSTTYTSNNGGYGSASSGGQTGQWIQYTSLTPSGTISTKGEDGTNKNMPAYRTVYMYRRTA